MIATDMSRLPPPSAAFDNLEHLDLFSSFYNFKRQGFEPRKAAKYISSFLPKGCVFKFSDDPFLKEIVTGSNWEIYLKKYRKFSDQFYDDVIDYIEVRTEEESRLREKYGITV